MHQLSAYLFSKERNEMMKLNQPGVTKRTRWTPPVPQSQQAHPDQVKNNAGGFTFTLTPEKQLERFLVLGSTAGTYYVGKNRLTVDNLKNIASLLVSPGVSKQAVIDKAVQYSVEGRVISNDTCLAALAMVSAYGDSSTKARLPEALNQVARTGTDILHFTSFANDLRGWGRSLKKLVAQWYTNKTPDAVAFQAGVKYKSRDGWSQRDVLRVCHPKSNDVVMTNVFKYITKGEHIDTYLPPIIMAAEKVKANPTEKMAVDLILNSNLPREAVPTELLNSTVVWEALAQKSPPHALIRNLAKMTSINVLKPLGDTTAMVVRKLSDVEALKRARVHPMAILIALRTYQKGMGDKGSLVWKPVPEIVAALEAAFFNSFGNVIPSGKKIMMGLDISGSMGNSFIGSTNMTAREASFYMALVTAKIEPVTYTVAFDSKTHSSGIKGLMSASNGVRSVNLTGATNLGDYDRVCGKWSGGRTDCALPMLHAFEQALDVDCFVIYTDNETWCGQIHPHVALEQYNNKFRTPNGKPKAKLIVVGMTATNFTIAKPGDPDMLDVVGFDTNVPTLITNFAKGYF